MFDYHPRQNVLEDLRAVFDTVSIAEESDTGFGYVAVARKAFDTSE